MSKEMHISIHRIDEKAELKDEYGRLEFSKALADAVVPEYDDCIVVGFEGSWGSGKTYVAEMARREVEKLSEGDRNAGKIKWINFNPWYFSDREHLARLLLTTVADEIYSESLLRGIFRKIRNFFRFIFKILSFLKKVILPATSFLNSLAPGFLIPSFGRLDLTKLEEIGGSLKDYAAAVSEEDKAESSKTLLEIKGKTAALLASNANPFKRIIVNIEDLDRLEPKEVQDIFRVIKMVADFPKITYLLGYDRDYVTRVLGKVFGNELGEEHLQKIFDVSYALPEVEERRIIDMFFNDIAPHFSKIYGEDFHRESYWKSISNSFSEPRSRAFKTMREARAVLNRVHPLLKSLKNKSNPGDVLIATYLAQTQPKLWAWMGLNKAPFVFGGLTYFEPTQRLTPKKYEEVRDDIQKMLVGDENRKRLVIELIRLAFPAIFSDRAPSFSLEERKNYLMGDADYIASYFQHSVSSAADLREFLEDLLSESEQTRDRALGQIQRYGEEDLLTICRDILEAAQKRDLGWDEILKPVLSGISSHVDSMPFNFFRHVQYQFIMLAFQLIARLSPDEKKDGYREFLAGLWAQDAKFLGLMAVDFLKSTDRYADTVNKSFQETFDIDEAEYKDYVDRTIQELGQWCSDNKILAHSRAGEALFMWERINKEGLARKIEEWLKNDWSFFAILKALLSESHITSGKREGAIVKKVLPVSALKKILKLEVSDIQKRVKHIQIHHPYISEKDEFKDVILAVKNLGKDPYED